MYIQKTVVSESPEQLDKEINKLYNNGYMFVGTPVMSKTDEGTHIYMQTVIKPLDK